MWYLYKAILKIKENVYFRFRFHKLWTALKVNSLLLYRFTKRSWHATKPTTCTWLEQPWERSWESPSETWRASSKSIWVRYRTSMCLCRAPRTTGSSCRVSSYFSLEYCFLGFSLRYKVCEATLNAFKYIHWSQKRLRFLKNFALEFVLNLRLLPSVTDPDFRQGVPTHNFAKYSTNKYRKLRKFWSVMICQWSHLINYQAFISSKHIKS